MSPLTLHPSNLGISLVVAYSAPQYKDTKLTKPCVLHGRRILVHFGAAELARPGDHKPGVC